MTDEEIYHAALKELNTATSQTKAQLDREWSDAIVKAYTILATRRHVFMAAAMRSPRDAKEVELLAEAARNKFVNTPADEIAYGALLDRLRARVQDMIGDSGPLVRLVPIIP